MSEEAGPGVSGAAEGPGDSRTRGSPQPPHLPGDAPAEPSWPPRLAVVGGLVLYLSLPSAYAPGPRWLPPLLIGLLVVPMVIANPVRLVRHSGGWRAVSIAAVAILTVFNIVSVAALVHGLLNHEKVDGRTLILSAIEIWLTNVLVFGIWYWELDAGGPIARRERQGAFPDFLFIQQANPGWAPPEWVPRFVDYLYTSFTNSTAFSPTDTMPLSPAAKMLMLGQASVALVTVAVVAARAVNILS